MDKPHVFMGSGRVFVTLTLPIFTAQSISTVCALHFYDAMCRLYPAIHKPHIWLNPLYGPVLWPHGWGFRNVHLELLQLSSYSNSEPSLNSGVRGGRGKGYIYALQNCHCTWAKYETLHLLALKTFENFPANQTAVEESQEVPFKIEIETGFSSLF